MGTYTWLARDFNGRAVYKREGRDPIYVYFFTSQMDQLSLWVIGPQLGQFIAGIKNSKPEITKKEEISDVIDQVFTDTTTRRSQSKR